MHLSAAFHPDVLYQSLRIWTFPSISEPHYREFKTVGAGLRIRCRMKELGRRSEVGLLDVDASPAEPPREASIRVIARGFRILRWYGYSSPECAETSAAKFDLNIGELWVASNAFPCHLAVRLDGQAHGTPEFDWQAYRRNHV